MKLSTTSSNLSIRIHLVSACFNVFVVVSGPKTKLSKHSKHLLWHSFFGNFYIIFYGTNAKIIK